MTLKMTAAMVTMVLIGCSEAHSIRDGGADDGGRVDGATADAGPSDGGEDWTSCDVPSVCVLASNTCCGVCGRPTIGDYDAVRNDLASRYFNEVICPPAAPGPTMCAGCAVMPNPSLVATCDTGACAGIDIETHPVSECASDVDCIVRTPRCCECGASTSVFDVVAINGARVMELMNLVCDPDTGCDFCAPDPPTATAHCGDDGHCHVDLGSGP